MYTKAIEWNDKVTQRVSVFNINYCLITQNTTITSKDRFDKFVETFSIYAKNGN